MKFFKRNQKGRFTPLMIFLLVFLIVYTLSLFLLLYWGFITTFKDAYADFPINDGLKFPEKWVPDYYEYFLHNYKIDIFGGRREAGLLEMFHNSFVYAIGCAFFQTLVPCLTAYVCARYKYKFLKIYYYIVIITMVIPIIGSTASEIQMATTLGLYDQLWGLWIMKANFLGLYFLIFYEQFKNMPMAYSEAAKTDGAGDFTILFRIMHPLAKNTFLTVFLIYFISFWNDYQTPFLYLQDRPTIFYAIYGNVHLGFANEVASIPGQLSLAFLGLIPTTVLFICFHKKLLGNITVGGIK